MPQWAYLKQIKPGFLLIETMVALLILVITASIMAQYVGFLAQKRHSMQKDLKGLLLAGQMLDQAQEGDLLQLPRNTEYQITQQSHELIWSDGVSDTIWQVSVHFDAQDSKGKALATFTSHRC